jgi:hypothetical protein
MNWETMLAVIGHRYCAELVAGCRSHSFFLIRRPSCVIMYRLLPVFNLIVRQLMEGVILFHKEIDENCPLKLGNCNRSFT